MPCLKGEMNNVLQAGYEIVVNVMEEVKDLVSVFFSINFTDSHDCCMFTSSFEALKASRVYSNYSSCAGDFSHPLFTLVQPHFLPTAAAHFIDFPHMTYFLAWRALIWPIPKIHNLLRPISL